MSASAPATPIRRMIPVMRQLIRAQMAELDKTLAPLQAKFEAVKNARAAEAAARAAYAAATVRDEQNQNTLATKIATARAERNTD